MGVNVLPYVPQVPSAVPVEIQRIGHNHPMRSMPPHGHTFHELLAIRAGNGFHTIGETVFKAEPGMVFLIAPGVQHDARNLGDVDAWVILFLADCLDDDVSTPGSVLERLFQQPVLRMTRPIALAQAEFTQADELIAKMATELSHRQAGYDIAVKAHLQLLLVQIARGAGCFEESRPAAAVNDLDQDWVNTVFSDIDSHFADDCSLKAASERLGLNASYLTTKLRQLTGKTFGDWVIERKMIEARRMLGNTADSVSDIAARLGYAEIESFVRRFKAHHATTPSQWRRVAREQTGFQP